jgi:hypothetical protein
MKKLYVLVCSAVLCFQFLNAQNCPNSVGTQSTITEPHFKITSGTCNDYPDNITIDGSNFTKNGCNGTNMYYILVPPDPVLASEDTFTADFGFSTCQYINGQLQTLSVDANNVQRSLIISPNPMPKNSPLSLQFDKPISGHIDIFNSLGKRIFSDAILHSDSKVIEVTTLSSGLYIIRITSSNGNMIKKLLVQ